MNEEYLTTPQLSDRIKHAPQTIYNNVSKGTWKLGQHYVKPSSRKILFKWSAIHAWLDGSCGDGQREHDLTIEACGSRDEGSCGSEPIGANVDDGEKGRNIKKASVKPKCRINI